MRVGCDFHVHLYPALWDRALSGGGVARALCSASQRAVRAQCDAVILCLTERDQESPAVFESLVLDSELNKLAHVEHRAHTNAVHISPRSDIAVDITVPITIFAGFQVISAEGLEVHALGTSIRPASGQTLAATIAQIIEQGGTPMLGWGLGKWLGRRGAVIREWLAASADSIKTPFFLGDSRHRCWGWPKPDIFAQAPILLGSDPLPLSTEGQTILSYGEVREIAASVALDATLALSTVLNAPRIAQIGRRLDPFSGAMLQLKLRRFKQ